MKRIFGNPIVGVWYLPDGTTIMPNFLKQMEEDFEWKADKPDYPNNTYPYKDGVALEYDEEM